MFDKNYKNAMDSISPDNETREKILDKIILKEELKSRRNPAIPWRVAFACVACIAIILGIIFVPKTSFVPTTNNGASHQTLTVAKSYNEIYKLIKPKRVKKKVVANGTVDMDAIEIIEEEMEYVADDTATNSLAKPDASKGGSANNDTNTQTATGNNDDFSTTTEQVDGVAEADIVKTDGEYIYYINDTTLSIFTADGENSVMVSQTKLPNTIKYLYEGEMFLKDERLILINTDYYQDPFAENFVQIVIYDISDPAEPKKVAESCQEGRYNSSRMVGNYIYLISKCYINLSDIDKDDPTTFVPVYDINGACEAVPADSIYRYAGEEYPHQYTVIGAFNYKDGTLSDTASLLGGTDNIYCSQGNIILADTRYNEGKRNETYVSEKTVVSKLAIEKGNIEYKTSGEVDGTLKNQFFIDEHNGYFRFVTTVTQAVEKTYKFENSDEEVVSYSQQTFARLTMLDSALKKVGEIKDLAQGERVYSVRFMGDIAYFVTFRQTDPLFSADLSDPANPKILGELKIPGFSEYMYPYGDGLLLGFGMDADEKTGRTKDLKLSMFNIADPANVTEQDKTIVEGYSYSTALENHKAMLVSPAKNLIGFPTYDPTYNATGSSRYKYMIYEYIGDGFVKKSEISIPWNSGDKFYYDSIRGIFIGDNFYVVSEQSLQVFDINSFLQIRLIEF